VIVTKQTPLQPKEIAAIAQAEDLDHTCRQLKLASRPSIPLEIVRAYETLDHPKNLDQWIKQTTRNLALHRLAVEANRSSWIAKQSSSWGSQYSLPVNLYLLAHPKYRQREWLPVLQPVFHPQLYQACAAWDPDLELSLDWLLQVRAATIERYKKPAIQITKPVIRNHYNLQPLNWVVLLELWVCVPELQHKNQLLSWLGHKPLQPQPLFETPHCIP